MAGAVAMSASTWAGSSRTRRVDRSTDAPARGERVEDPVAEDLHADLGQDPERRAMDRLDLVGGQDLERAERVDQPAPRELGEPGRGAARTAARAGVRVGGSGVGRASSRGSSTTGCYGRRSGTYRASWRRVARSRAPADFSCVSQTSRAQ